MEEAHQVATTAPPKLNITTTTAASSVKLNSHMVGKERESISNEVLQETASSRGAGRRGARNRAAVRSGGRGLVGSRMRSRWVARYCPEYRSQDLRCQDLEAPVH